MAPTPASAPSRNLPVRGIYDLVVAGGSTGGVAAALAAAGRGLRALVIAPEPYLGEDIAATGRLLRPDGGPSSALFERLYPGPFAEPLAVKAALEEALLEAGVDFEFASAPTGLLRDASGLAGVVFSGKGGAFAALARTVLDATPAAALARLAGVPFTPWPEGATAVFSRVVAGPRPMEMCRPYEVADALRGARKPEGVAVERLGEVSIEGAGGRRDDWPLFRYAMRLPAPGLSPETVAAAEDALRTVSYRARIGWAAPRVDWLPLDGVAGGPVPCQSGETVDLAAFRTPVGGLHVIGPCAAVSRADAEILRGASHLIAAGARLGAAVVASGAIDPAACSPLAPAARPDPRRTEPPRDFLRAPDLPRVSLGAFPALPVLAKVDVLVVGGGTGGAPAAVAAARAGAKTLLLEAQHDLGGIGTLGAINLYWYGSRTGFSAESAQSVWSLCENDPLYRLDSWNAIQKAEWLRRMILKAGGAVWFGSLATGALLEGEKVRGVAVSTPWGRGIVEAKAVVDATGSADVAHAAGAACADLCDRDLAVQGSGLPPQPIPPRYFNTDYTFIDDTDPLDLTRAMAAARRRYRGNFDNSPLPGSRDRRQVVGDVFVTPVDLFLDRTWRDAVCRSTSDFDRHGYPTHPLFHVTPPPRGISFYGDLPLRALLPKGVSALLVTGLGISCHRDAMPIYRMQADVQNEAYAAGIAAAMALEKDGEVRDIDVRELQRRLVKVGSLPPAATIRTDAPPPTPAELAALASAPLRDIATVAAFFARPDVSRGLLRPRLLDASDPQSAVVASRLLALFGDEEGARAVAARVRETPWDTGLSLDEWHADDLGGESDLDADIQILAAARVAFAGDAVVDKVRSLSDPVLSHVRAVCEYAEAVRNPSLAAPLANLLRKPGVAGHDRQTIPAEIEDLADVRRRPAALAARNLSVRELFLARALFLCGDCGGLGGGTLRRYATDIRACYARFAGNALRRKGE